MLNPFATPDDVAAIWRPLSDAEQGVAFARLEQASRKIRGDIPLIDGLSVDARILAGLLDAGDVKDVAVEMVKRVMALPSYIRQQSVTVDDATKSSTYDATASTGVMFIADEERKTLMGWPTGGAFTITPNGDPAYVGISYSQRAALEPAYLMLGTSWM